MCQIYHLVVLLMLLRTRGAYMKRIMGLESNQVHIVFKLAARIVMTLVVVVVSWCMEIDIMWVSHSYVSASCMYRGWVWCMGKNGQESW